MTAAVANLQKRYTRVVAMQAVDPARFQPNPMGPEYLTRDERYNTILRHLRLRMPETWAPGEAHHLHMAERLASLAEHVYREKAFAAAVARLFPLTGDERLVWSTLDEAYRWVQAALEIVRGGDGPNAIGDIKVVADL